MLTLTWQSMNMDGYLYRITSAMQRLQSLIAGIRSIMTNDIEQCLLTIRRMQVVSFPDEGQFALAEFVEMQKDAIKEKSLQLVQLRNSIEDGISLLLDVIRKYRLESEEDVVLREADADSLRADYGELFYLALLGAIKNSFAAIKRRLASRRSSRFMLIDRPFFDMEILLVVPRIQLQPSLDEVQEAISQTARLVLEAVKSIPLLGSALA